MIAHARGTGVVRISRGTILFVGTRLAVHGDGLASFVMFVVYNACKNTLRFVIGHQMTLQLVSTSLISFCKASIWTISFANLVYNFCVVS